MWASLRSWKRFLCFTGTNSTKHRSRGQSCSGIRASSKEDIWTLLRNFKSPAYITTWQKRRRWNSATHNKVGCRIWTSPFVSSCDDLLEILKLCKQPPNRVVIFMLPPLLNGGSCWNVSGLIFQSQPYVTAPLHVWVLSWCVRVGKD